MDGDEIVKSSQAGLAIRHWYSRIRVLLHTNVNHLHKRTAPRSMSFFTQGQHQYLASLVSCWFSSLVWHAAVVEGLLMIPSFKKPIEHCRVLLVDLVALLPRRIYPPSGGNG